MRVPVMVVIAFLSNVAVHAGQSVSPARTFEVVSIKPVTGDRQLPRPSSPDRFVEPDTTLRELVEYAYELTSIQVAGGPPWMATRHFAIDAKTTGTPTRVEMRLLVRNLLASRFNLKAHNEKREMAVYLLERARADGSLGPKLRATPTIDCATVVAQSDTNGAPNQPSCGIIRATPVGLAARDVAISQLARNIRDLGSMTGVDRIVLDKTSLPGGYDIEEMNYRPVATSQLAGGDDNPGFFDALREQLGLKLTPSRAAVDVLVIDSVSEPSPN